MVSKDENLLFGVSSTRRIQFLCTLELNGLLGLIGPGELGGLGRQGKLGGLGRQGELGSTQLSDCMDLEEFAAVVSP